MLLWLQKVQNYYKSLNMPYICITKRRILGESFCVAQWSPSSLIIAFVFED